MNGKRQNHLDTLKFLAAVLVFTVHLIASCRPEQKRQSAGLFCLPVSVFSGRNRKEKKNGCPELIRAAVLQTFRS